MPKPSLIEILTCLHEFFPQAFVLEQHLSHRPLKVGIDGDLAERCPALDRRERAAVLRLYVSRVMYLQACVAGAARVDLDGNPAGEVTAAEAAFAADKIAEIMAARESRKAAAAEKPAPSPSKPASPAISTRVQRPLLRLPAFRKKAVGS
jgi:ProP effector